MALIYMLHTQILYFIEQKQQQKQRKVCGGVEADEKAGTETVCVGGWG